VSFNEKAILNQKQQHNMTFESLYVNNKEVLPQDDSEILENTLAFTDEIELKPGHNVFTIDYSACNYIKTSKNTYRYKLENFDADWIEAGDQSSVTYTNLNPGNYTLRVQGLSGVEGVVIGEKSLDIRVLPPLYRTWYAVVFYILLTIFIVLWIKRMYRNRIILENRIKSEQREKNQINQLNQSKLEFFTNISHEFRTPLTLISGTLESILENPKTLKENQAKIISTHKNVTRLNNLVTELLDFRKLELGYNSLKVHEVDFEQFMEDIYNSFVDYAQYHAIAFNYTQKLDINLWIDRTQMEKVFYNLLSNAFKFVDDVHGKVSMHVSETPDAVQVLIEDNGIGISKEKMDNIFDPYYQIDNIQISPKRKGSGIGLALCKQILTEHAGEISVNSDENGTVFTIRLLKGKAHYKESDFATEIIDVQPNTLKVFEIAEVADTIDITNLPEMDHQHLSLLIVEDNPEARKLLRSIFESTYKIYEAEDGEEGVRRAIEMQPTVIISDVMMPKVSGTELCAKLKRNIQTSHIPIILLTAKATEEFKIEGLEIGADDYITKPFSNKLLRAKVKNIIQNRLLLQQKFRNDPHIKVSEVTSNTLDQKFLDQARAIVLNHIDQTEFVAQDFAREMGVGRSKLFDKIKGITGQTPNEFIVSIRLAKAAEMLLNEHDELNISEIAYTVGFSTASYFSKCFKQHFGVTPTEYVLSGAKKE
jgi:signal transduction histidine kinase/DNA-binding response OmpR family regulator